MNYSVFTVNKKIGAKTAKFDSKRSQKLKTASKQEINRQTFILRGKVQNRAQKEANQAEK
jgi:hypothetical protein